MFVVNCCKSPLGFEREYENGVAIENYYSTTKLNKFNNNLV